MTDRPDRPFPRIEIDQLLLRRLVVQLAAGQTVLLMPVAITARTLEEGRPTGIAIDLVHATNSTKETSS